MDKNAVLFFFSILTVIGEALIVLILIAFFLRQTKPAQKLLKFLSENYLPSAFLITSFITLGSLIFSEILHFDPCKLCWFQRIFMYPQVIIFLIALLKKDRNVWRFSLALSLFGFSIALYHIFLQLYPSTLPCSDEIISCAKTQFRYFGHITIPVMSATGFFLLSLLSLIGKKNSK